MTRALLLTILIAAPVWADLEISDDALMPVAEPVASPAPVSEPQRAEQLDADDSDEEGGDERDEEGEAEVEAAVNEALTDAGIRYSSDLSDEELTKRWVESPDTLGSISVGLTEAGRLVNGVPVPPDGEAWKVVDANNAWGTQETVDFLMAAGNSVHEQFPNAPPLRINHIGRKNGGYLRPHQSHQAGRDVDLGFFYPNGEDPGHLSKKRELAMDLAVNWALLKALITTADVEFVLVDKRIQARIYEYALSKGEDKTWLDKLFHAGPASLVKHARRHRDHFHVRFFSGRSQELGRRIQPLLAKQPDQNVLIYRVKKGDTLGGIAGRYNSSVKLIQKANGLSNTSLRVGRTLNVPIRGPCTNCPVPPPLVIPPRCLPPEAPSKS